MMLFIQVRNRLQLKVIYSDKLLYRILACLSIWNNNSIYYSYISVCNLWYSTPSYHNNPDVSLNDH